MSRFGYRIGRAAFRMSRVLPLLAAVASIGVVAACRDSNPAREAGVAQPVATQQPAPPAPEGMVYIPGGTTEIGSVVGLAVERPVFEARVSGFFLDRTPVTVAQFARFVDSTAFVTEAERFGNAGVLVDKQWALVDGATWRQPAGPQAPPAADDHPVTQVSWNDAVAYCESEDKRLPTEVEWEHAARGARNSRAQYAWGDELTPGDVHRANTWQGTFPEFDTGDDGFLSTSPVGAFGETELGLTDVAGNVWEWTVDWFRPYGRGYDNFTPEPNSERVQRGGSFLCNKSWCHGFRVSARGHSSPETSLFHVGFRCARSVGVY